MKLQATPQLPRDQNCHVSLTAAHTSLSVREGGQIRSGSRSSKVKAKQGPGSSLEKGGRERKPRPYGWSVVVGGGRGGFDLISMDEGAVADWHGEWEKVLELGPEPWGGERWEHPKERRNVESTPLRNQFFFSMYVETPPLRSTQQASPGRERWQSGLIGSLTCRNGIKTVARP